MIEIGGIAYKLDLDAMDRYISTGESLQSGELTETEVTEIKNKDGEVIRTKSVTVTRPKARQIDAGKFEMIRYMIDVVMSYGGDLSDDDPMMGKDVLDNANISFNIAYNTLVDNKILIKLQKKS